MATIKVAVIALRDSYERLCMRLASFPEDENLARSKQKAGESAKPKINQPSGIVGKQATQPELNDSFIRGGISL